MPQSLSTSKKTVFIFIIVLIFVASLFLRLYHISQPADKVFDEVYFPVFAQDYITHTDFFDSHPPLGKLAIAASELIWGNNPLGWRFMNAVAGMALLLTVLAFTYELTKRWQTAMLAYFLIAIEPMALVESRIGVINIYLALFSILGLWLFWRWYTRRETWVLILALIAFAAASAVKWIGLGAFGAAALFYLIDTFSTKGKQVWKKILPPLILALIVMPIIYFATFIPDILRHQDLWWWHKSAFEYHAHLKATHPYGSTWWSWAIVLRPVWLYYNSPSPGVVKGIIEIGNVVTWIGGLAAVIFMLSRLPKSDYKKRNTFLILCYLALYLPWIFIERVKFIYHYFDPVIILLIILAIVSDENILNDKRTMWVGIVFLALGYAFFVYFLPLLMGLPISQAFYQQHMWLRSWI